MRLKLMLVLATSLLVGACSKTTATGGTECSLWQPISWSVKDTPQTISEVKVSNARRRAFCEGVRP